MEITIESLRDEDAETRWDLGRQAFGATAAFDPDLATPAADRTVAAYDGDRLVGTVVTLAFSMSWNGGGVPCGGVSGVVVRPEDRGRGVAKQLLRESFERMVDRGEVLSALYPTTATLYRGVGYEVVGSYEWRKVPLGLVPTAPAEVLDWRRVPFDDPGIRSVHETMASGFDGWMRPDDVWWERRQQGFASEVTKNRYAYLGSSRGIDRAAVVYRYDSSEDRLYELGIDLVAGVDLEDLAAALGFLAGNGTTAGHLETTLPAGVLAMLVPNFQHTAVTSDWPWMLRLVDLAGAFLARPWPSVVAGAIEVDIVDDTVPANAGPRVIEFARGSAAVTHGGSGRVTVTVNDLARIYAGADVRLLYDAGLLEGATLTDVDLLRAACASSPTMPFFF